MHVKKRVGVLGLVAALAVALGILGPGQAPERTEAIFPVGGISALPSAIPALAPIGPPANFPGLAQTLPAIAPASGPGSFAIVDAFCSLGTELTFNCPTDRTGSVAPIEFTMNKVLPPGEPVRASFVANGQQTLKCQDDATCDLSDPTFEGTFAVVQHVAVGITGGGDNEIIEVTACDVTGDCRSVLVVFVESILSFNPNVVADAAAENPTFVLYRCEDIGLYTAEAASGIVPGIVTQTTPEVSWEEVFDWFYSVQFVGSGALAPSADRPFYNCGGDTPGNPFDDRVTFETDVGIFTIEALADGAATAEPFQGGTVLVPLGTLSTDCDVGDSVDVVDHPGPVTATRGIWTPPVPEIPADWCDVDFAPNGVVSYVLLGTGEAGVPTVTAQQTGGGGVLRTTYPTFTGTQRYVFFAETPEFIGPEGGNFQVVIIDDKFRFIGGQTVHCSAEPKDAVLMIVPQTGTTGLFPEPWLNFKVIPTLSALQEGVELTVTCYLDSNPDVKPILGPAVVPVGQPPESFDLVAGCNPVTSTWPDETPIETVVEGVAPAEALDAIWVLDPESGAWQGYSAAAPEASDLASVNQLQPMFVCTNASGAISRPEI